MERGKITAEWDPLCDVVIHRPGIEMRLGLLEPYGSLYERAFSYNGARHEHEEFEHVLRNQFGANVFRLEDEIVTAADERPELREKLVELARDSIVYSGTPENVAAAAREFETNAKFIDTDQILHWWMLKPIVDIEAEPGTRNVHVKLGTREPPANLYFMRDQQLVTDKGIVMARMAKPVRRHEPAITHFLWHDCWGLPIAHVTEAPGTIEGGEFMPMGEFAVIGIGDRTNPSAIEQLMECGIDLAELAVVHQPNHPLLPADRPDPMIDMHLDTYFNVAARHVVVGHVGLWEAATVEVWHNIGDRFEKEQAETNLYDFITGKGFDVVAVTTLEQLCYAPNFLCIRDGVIAAIETERDAKSVLANLEVVAHDQPKRYGKLLAQARQDYEELCAGGGFFPHKAEMFEYGIEAYPLVLKNLTGGYGGAHCMTCSLARGATEPVVEESTGLPGQSSR